MTADAERSGTNDAPRSGFNPRRGRRKVKEDDSGQSTQTDPTPKVKDEASVEGSVQKPASVMAAETNADVDDVDREPAGSVTESVAAAPTDHGDQTLGLPSEDVVAMGFHTTNELWRAYKALANRTAAEGRPVKAAQIIRSVLSEHLPSSSTERGLLEASRYAEGWKAKQTPGGSVRGNRQLYLPSSMILELRRLSATLDDRGHPASMSAIVSGVLDTHRPSMAAVYKAA